MERQNFSYHNHTYRCGHAYGIEEQYIESAIESGIKYFGFSDHCPYMGIHIPSDRMDYEQIDEYLNTIRGLSEKYKDQIEIKVGFEAEYIEGREEELKALRDKCDYLVLGQHNFDMKNIGSKEVTFYVSDTDVLEYARLVVKGIESGLYAFVAHPDYFMLGRRNWNGKCEEAASLICEAASRCCIPLEVNLKGTMMNERNYGNIKAVPYPFRKFFEVAAKYNVHVIYSHDAHKPLAYDDEEAIKKANEILKGLDLHFINFHI